MRRPLRTLQVAAIALSVVAVLFCVQSGSASYRRFRDFDVNAIYIGPICTDGIAIGIKHESAPRELELRKVQAYLLPTNGGALLDETQILTTSYQFRDLRITEPGDQLVDHWNTFCRAFDNDAMDTENRTCGGPFYVEWNPPLTPGTVIDIHYYRNVGGAWQQVSTLASNPLNLPETDRTVEDCRVHDLPIQLIQAVPTVATTQDNTALVFNVATYDYNWPNLVNGQGIAFVTLAVLDTSGNAVYTMTDTDAPYCAFGNDALPACLVWDFARHSDTWPSGQPLVAGTYRLRATVYGLSGSIQTREWPVELARSSNPTSGETSGEPPLLRQYLPALSSQP